MSRVGRTMTSGPPRSGFGRFLRSISGGLIRGAGRPVAPCVLVGLLCLSNVCPAQTPDSLVHKTILVDGRSRSYAVYIPDLRAGDRVPLVIVLHGQGGSGVQALTQGHWLQAAMQHHFALVAPDGVLADPGRPESFIGNRRSWNAGPSLGAPAEAQGVDDVGFLGKVLDQVQRDPAIDRTRAYISGFSNGAAMALRAAAELPNRFAAVAPVSNALLVPVARNPTPPSLLLIWGTADPLNPIAGGEVKRAGQIFMRPSAAQTLRAWGTALGCSERELPATLAPGIEEFRLEGCPAGQEAKLVTIAGLGHQWPGGETYVRMIAGPGSDALDATTFIWGFFATHRLAQQGRRIITGPGDQNEPAGQAERQPAPLTPTRSSESLISI
jgi:polyhydroxybutyrate depolymerase